MINVHSIFRTVQGEGSKAGTPAVFLRLVGCNLWSGNIKSRDKGRGDCAQWCDTDFFRGTKMDVEIVVQNIIEYAQMRSRLVVITGGEPMLQLSRNVGKQLLRKLKAQGFTIAIETNGTVECDDETWELIDHITVSPKGLLSEPGTLDHICQRSGTDLKVIVPMPWQDKTLKEFRKWKFNHFYLQPMDQGEKGKLSIDRCVRLAEQYDWRISCQTHKFMGWE